MIAAQDKQAEPKKGQSEAHVDDRGIGKTFREYVQPIELFNVLNSRKVSVLLGLCRHVL